MKVAVCLVVKNEQLEIVYWIAWYKALGFDTIIIYDDFSDDETENVILSLKNTIDIRYHRNAFNKDIHHIRQIRAYKNTITKYKQEFNWIAFFDSDEYLDLYGKNIKDYLMEMNHASLVAFNWCCVGTNNYISRPPGIPVINYTLHGSNELFWNKHTKVIVKPLSISKPLYHVHNIMVEGQSVDSAGDPIEWEGDHGGFTKDYPTWAGGRLIHYQTRSLEHYVIRDRNIEEIRKNKQDPVHNIVSSNDYNQIEINISEIYLQNFYKIMKNFVNGQGRIVEQIIASIPFSYFLYLKDLYSPKQVSIFDPHYEYENNAIPLYWISHHSKPGNILKDKFNSEKKVLAFQIKNYFNYFLCVCNEELSVHDDKEPVIALLLEDSDYIHLCTQSSCLLKVKGDPRIGSVLSYKVWGNPNETISLSHPDTNRYLSFDEHGKHCITKMRAYEWESFSLLEINLDNCTDTIKETAEYLKSSRSFYEMQILCQQKKEKNGLIFNAITSLDDASKKAIKIISRGILSEHNM
ncbi:glycosyltransferase family 2 protein [Commensalibacter papalotli (ex Servin-Garciduenas et al. 2014)]|uniref:Uncharacterized protein n=1 Tax=Commensalibacter papalotli (ex Servin-Garciduenas et al. 2014) TaxID=1208583 RepID=W7DJA4_9PROT|nr:glycosyltransferase family 2 protein [Commensalibacter papalotli (ex Servin-Garciduenas et al. 2014)]EUK17422.1 hypothetical protein COMX_10400 [Commensalibacter papalotli (ex Servin-Garciduenas et al. 2014)]